MHNSRDFMKRAGALGSALAWTALIAVLLAGGSGCPTAGKPRGIPVIDLAVGSPGNAITCKGDSGSPFDVGEILLYFDVLNGGNQQDPDVVISGASVPQVVVPASIVLTESDLYVADPYSNRVMIWRHYRSLGAKGGPSPMPDVELTTGLGGPSKIIVEDNRLFVLILGGQPGVAVYQDAAGLTGDVAPDLIVPFLSPNGMAYEDDHLYISGNDNVPNTSGQVVEVYNSVTNLLNVKNGGPDAVLAGPSWANLDQGGPVIPSGLKVANNELYVSTQTNFVFVFSPADNLVSEQPPDAVMSEANGTLSAPYPMACVGNRLFVGNTQAPVLSKDLKSNTAGLVGYDHADRLVTGQTPAVVFDTANAQIASVTDLAAEDDYLFVAASNSTTPFVKCKDGAQKVFFGSYYEVGDVHIFSHADRLTAGRQADIVLPALKDFTLPIAIDTNRRFAGEN